MTQAVCLATTYYNNYDKLVEACDMTSGPMKCIDAKTLEVRYEER